MFGAYNSSINAFLLLNLERKKTTAIADYIDESSSTIHINDQLESSLNV